MKVLIISNLFSNSKEKERGVFTYQIVKKLKNRCRVEVIAPLPWIPEKFNSRYPYADVPSVEEFGGIKVHHPRYLVIPKILGFMHAVFMFLPLLKAVKKVDQLEKIDLINAHWIFPDGVAACWVSRVLKKPIILTALGCDINLYTYMRLRRFQIVNALKKANSITSVANNIKNRMVNLKIQKDRIRVIPNGVDPKLFYIADKKEARKRIGLPIEKNIIITVGSQDEVKGTGFLIDALAMMHKKLDQVPLIVLVGQGPLRDALSRKANELNVSDHVFFAGEKPHDEIPLWMNAADIFCLPSIREGHPNVVIEALSCGVPVVASNVGAIAEIINESNGKIFDVGDTYDLCDRLMSGLEAQWDREVIRFSVANYDWESCADKYYNSYVTFA